MSGTNIKVEPETFILEKPLATRVWQQAFSYLGQAIIIQVIHTIAQETFRSISNNHASMHKVAKGFKPPFSQSLSLLAFQKDHVF